MRSARAAFQAKNGAREIFEGGIFDDVHSERGFTGAGTSRDNDKFAVMESVCKFIQHPEARGYAFEGVYVRFQGVELVDDLAEPA